MLPHDEHKPIRKLKIDMQELTLAFENTAYELDYYLDVETGEVLFITEDTRHYLDSLDMTYDMEPDSAGAEDPLEHLNLPDWAREDVNKALEIEAGYGTRYISVPKVTSRDGYRDMEDFIDTVEDQHLHDLLRVAIDGKGAFRRFKDVLYNYPQERERWFAFQGNRLERRVLDWLESEGIQPVN